MSDKKWLPSFDIFTMQGRTDPLFCQELIHYEEAYALLQRETDFEEIFMLSKFYFARLDESPVNSENQFNYYLFDFLEQNRDFRQLKVVAHALRESQKKFHRENHAFQLKAEGERQLDQLTQIIELFFV